MSNLTKKLVENKNEEDDSVYKPRIFRLSSKNDQRELDVIINKIPSITIKDTILDQLRDLIKLENPDAQNLDRDIKDLIDAKLDGKEFYEFGTWVFYPWRNTLVHTLDEADFLKVRTIRNRYKINQKEQDRLKDKTVGIIGLSVGQSVAMAIAMERISGTLRLADFDILELSNLNRIRTSVSSIGLAKTIVVAREIAEIDPFIKVELFTDGINQGNMEDFFLKNGKLDLLVEEGDDIEIKVQVRKLARSLKIPVVMDTSDLFLLDIERFDLEPDREILHGLLDENINELHTIDRKQMALRLFELEHITDRGRESIYEIGKSITTWPQLATDVIAGGAVAAKFIREILLNNTVMSGRSRFDIVRHHNENARFQK